MVRERNREERKRRGREEQKKGSRDNGRAAEEGERN